MNTDNIFSPNYTPGEISRIKFYYNRFVLLYNEQRVDKDIDEFKFMRVLNVEISSFAARWPDEKHLNDEAVARFIKAIEELREKDRKAKGIKSYGPTNTPPR